MADPLTGRCALYDEPSQTGEPDDPNAPRNAPLNDPGNNLEYLYFHSDLDNMEVVQQASPSINHQPVPQGAMPPGASIDFGWNTQTDDHLLLTHNLGYVPSAMVIVTTLPGDDVMLWPGMPVQTQGDGGARYATVYCTETEVRLFESASTGSTNLSGANIGYEVLVFRDQPQAEGELLIDFDPGTGRVRMGLGKFDSSLRYLQVVPGGSPFFIPVAGRTIDLQNGAPRMWRSDGSYWDPVPFNLRAALGKAYGWPLTYGAGMHYQGGYPGPTPLGVQAP